MTDTSATEATTDGRELRSVRTRRAIIDALLLLIDEGDLAPTARQVAEQAGVGLRTVFQHFEDLEVLHIEAATRHIERIAPLLVTVSSQGPSQQRIDAMVRMRSKLFERITPVRRAVLNAEFRFETLANLIRVADDRFQADVERVFGAELDRPTKSGRAELLGALELALSWSAWNHLRQRRRLSITAAKAVVTRQLVALLAAGCAPPSRGATTWPFSPASTAG